MPKYRVRTTKTASGATAIQVVSYEKHITRVIKHIGSAKTQEELEVLRFAAEQYVTNHEPQLSLFKETPSSPVVLLDRIEVTQVSQQFARSILLAVLKQCHLDLLDMLYLDLAIMRIIEPCSKLRSIELIQRHFNVSYTQYVYTQLPKLLEQQMIIEEAAVKTAKAFNSTFTLLLYDVTTLYFETHKPDDELQARGFSKDDKCQQHSKSDPPIIKAAI